MYRIVKLTGKYYANNIDSNLALSVDEAESTIDLINTEGVVFLTNDLEIFSDELGIDLSDIEIVN